MNACFGRETKVRLCETCGVERPLVLFPRLQKRGRSKRCQLCRDQGVVSRKPKDVLKLRIGGRRARERRSEMVKALRTVSDKSRVNAGLETGTEERETV